jgi:uncharacterized protein YjbJ (UPF0337 family)
MNWDRMEGEWKQRRGKAVHYWGKVMNDDLASIAGRYEELVGRLQESYGIAKETTEQQIEEYKVTIAQLKKSNDELTKLQKTLSSKNKLGKQPVKSTLSPRKKRRPKGSS